MGLGKKARQIEMVDGFIVIGGWKNWKKYEEKLERYIDKHEIWNYKQNTLDLVVDDILQYLGRDDEEMRDFLYATLVKRGVAKWLYVRQLLIRYKKLVKEMAKDAAKKDDEYWRGYRDAMMQVRQDLKSLCNFPRWVLWNGKSAGAIWDKKIKGWIKVLERLYSVKFRK